MLSGICSLYLHACAHTDRCTHTHIHTTLHTQRDTHTPVYANVTYSFRICLAFFSKVARDCRLVLGYSFFFYSLLVIMEFSVLLVVIFKRQLNA